MILADPRSLETLDFDRIRERVAGQTHAAVAAATAAKMLPTSDAATIRQLVAETTEMRAIVRARGFSPGRIDDVGPAVELAERGSPLAARDVRAVADALAASTAAVRALREADLELPTLRELCTGFRALPAIVVAVTDAIDERGTVLDRASPALARTRRAIANAQDEARERTQSLARSQRYSRAVQEAIVTVRDGRFVIPIKAEFAGEFPGIVHDTSASGHTLFIEPLETLETNNRVRALRAQEEHEVARILAELSAMIGAAAGPIRVDLDLYVELDLAFARAAVAERMDAAEPQLADAATVDIRDGRHPLLDARAVPQSIRLDDEIRATIVSGPNMGGKTVALKMVGLFVAMVGCGMHVPAAAATVGRFTRIFTDIGDEQSIVQNMSSFSAHLGRLAEIVAAADDRSLILIDEIGSGTEPAAGAALAVALIERFIAVGARCVVTTHATELKLFGADHEHVRNASVRFDPATYAPTYQLDIGSPGQSLAFALAKTMHLDQAVIARAEVLLGEQQRDYERALDELAEERMRATRERERLQGERAHLRTVEDQARKRADALDRERRELAAKAEGRVSTVLRAFMAELERQAAEGAAGRARITRGQSRALGETLEAIHTELGIEQKRAPEQQAPAHIAVGDRVYIAAFDSEGTVVEDNGDEMVVQLGALRTSVRKRDLRAGGAPRPPVPRPRGPSAGATRLAAAVSARTELDVRGKRYVEAEPLVEQWIDASMLAGASPLRLIHGKGTGLLGRGLQQYLRKHANVRGVRYGSAEEGGSGVTVFELG